MNGDGDYNEIDWVKPFRPEDPKEPCDTVFGKLDKKHNGHCVLFFRVLSIGLQWVNNKKLYRGEMNRKSAVKKCEQIKRVLGRGENSPITQLRDSQHP